MLYLVNANFPKVLVQHIHDVQASIHTMLLETTILSDGCDESNAIHRQYLRQRIDEGFFLIIYVVLENGRNIETTLRVPILESCAVYVDPMRP